MPHRRGLSGFYGVTKIRVDKWRAVVSAAGRKVHLGQFDTKEVAAAAHDRVARHLRAAAAAPAALPVRKAQGKQPAADVPAAGPAGPVPG
jgi:hypothetical protein